MRVSGRRDMLEMLFATGIPFGGSTELPRTLRELAALMPRTAGIRRWGSAALDLAYLAAGPAAAGVPFSRADPNRDGVVTYEEAERVMPRLKQIQYTKADSNHDGVIDKGEYPMLDSYYGYIVNR
jgi:hypothetical protein